MENSALTRRLLGTAKPAVINVGIVSFFEDLVSQGVEVEHVDWRPPAGGNERLMAILERMKQRSQ